MKDLGSHPGLFHRSAQGLPPYQAAIAGVFLHGLAGEMVRQELGETGMVAGDLLPLLPQAIRSLK